MFCYIYYKIYKTQKLKSSPKISKQGFPKNNLPTFGPSVCRAFGDFVATA